MCLGTFLYDTISLLEKNYQLYTIYAHIIIISCTKFKKLLSWGSWYTRVLFQKSMTVSTVKNITFLNKNMKLKIVIEKQAIQKFIKNKITNVYLLNLC